MRDEDRMIEVSHTHAHTYTIYDNLDGLLMAIYRKSL